MKTVIILVGIVATLALFYIIFMWLLAMASGHNIPSKTNWTFGLSSLFFIVIILLSLVLDKKMRKNRKPL